MRGSGSDRIGEKAGRPGSLPKTSFKRSAKVLRTNTPWRYNLKDMKPCCKQSLALEMYRRQQAGEEVMSDRDEFQCNQCGRLMICEIGESGKLRWGLKRG